LIASQTMRFFVAGIATLMKKQFMQPKANRANQRHTFARRRIDPRGRFERHCGCVVK
jgi:hypothetical protein